MQKLQAAIIVLVLTVMGCFHAKLAQWMPTASGGILWLILVVTFLLLQWRRTDLDQLCARSIFIVGFGIFLAKEVIEMRATEDDLGEILGPLILKVVIYSTLMLFIIFNHPPEERAGRYFLLSWCVGYMFAVWATFAFASSLPAFAFAVPHVLFLLRRLPLRRRT
jgi:hypothetical protein